MTLRLRKPNFLLAVLLLALPFFVGGCASGTYWTWEHPTYGQGRLGADQQECRQLARQEANRNDFFYGYGSYPLYWPHFSRRYYYDPYWDWYYHDRFMRYQNDLDRYYRLCMKAKGWSLVKKQKEQPPRKASPETRLPD